MNVGSETPMRAKVGIGSGIRNLAKIQIQQSAIEPVCLTNELLTNIKNLS